MTDQTTPTLALPGHIKVDEPKGTAACAECGVSVHLPTGKFGYVRAVDMLAAGRITHGDHVMRPVQYCNAVEFMVDGTPEECGDDDQDMFEAVSFPITVRWDGDEYRWRRA